MQSRSAERSAILLIRLSAMGDVIHTLPAAISLKKSFPDRKLAWVIAPRWMPLLEGNPYVDEIIPFDRGRFGSLQHFWRRVRQTQAEWAFDFQGLMQSALIGRLSRSEALFGFDKSIAREPVASTLYTHRVPVKGPHRVERNVQLAEAAGARELTYEAWIPPGHPEGNLPSGSFVLTSPFAGWPGKEWPVEFYEVLAERLRTVGFELVASVPKNRVRELAQFKHVHVYTSTLQGLIDATHRASAIIGVDSGPLHLAAALGKPGVALFGPTDPLRTGPFGDSMAVLRANDVETTYKRHRRIHSSMKLIAVDRVLDALWGSLAKVSDSTAAHDTIAARHT
jgi:heptosyltransferase I